MEDQEVRERYCPYCGTRMSGIRFAPGSNWIHCYYCHTDFTVRKFREKTEEMAERRREVPQDCFEQMP